MKTINKRTPSKKHIYYKHNNKRELQWMDPRRPSHSFKNLRHGCGGRWVHAFVEQAESGEENVQMWLDVIGWYRSGEVFFWELKEGFLRSFGEGFLGLVKKGVFLWSRQMVCLGIPARGLMGGFRLNLSSFLADLNKGMFLSRGDPWACHSNVPMWFWSLTDNLSLTAWGEQSQSDWCLGSEHTFTSHDDKDQRNTFFRQPFKDPTGVICSVAMAY